MTEDIKKAMSQIMRRGSAGGYSISIDRVEFGDDGGVTLYDKDRVVAVMHIDTYNKFIERREREKK